VPLAVVAGVFLGIFALVAGAMLGMRKVLEDVGPEAVPGLSENAIDWDEPVHAPQLLREETLSTISFWDRILARIDGIHIMRVHLAEADLRWSVGRLTAMMLLAGAATFAILWQMSWVAPLWALLAAVGAAGSPYLVVRRRRRKRLEKLEVQFPDALDSMARALRAGNPLVSAMETLAREIPSPLSGEFRKVLDERSLGTNWDVALGRLAERIPVAEVSMFVAAVQLQSRTGGRLHEVIAKLAESMRESAALKGEVRAIAAHGRLTGIILTLLPVAIAALMAYVNPGHMLILWRNELGRNLVAASLVSLVLAHLVIRKLLEIRI
jgi:tight adherence protein B